MEIYHEFADRPCFFAFLFFTVLFFYFFVYNVKDFFKDRGEIERSIDVYTTNDNTPLSRRIMESEY
jgi:hypothetical protein